MIWTRQIQSSDKPLTESISREHTQHPNTTALRAQAAVAQAVISVPPYAVQMHAVSVWAEICADVADEMKNNMKKSYRLALCAVISALSLVMLLLTGLIPVGTYAFPCVAGVLLAVVVIEAGYSSALLVYAVVSVLSFFFVADKEAALYYVAFLGFYPALKGLLERLKSKLVQYILKFIAFNLCVTAAFFVSIYVLAVPKESFELFSMYLPWVFLLIGNVVFLLYDICLTRIITEYVNKWRNKLKFK